MSPISTRTRTRRGIDLDASADLDERSGADRPSRTARKKASAELQRVGERLVELGPNQLAALPLPETLREAVLDAQRLKSFGARRRQAQYIGKLMRRLDAETVEAVRSALSIVSRRPGLTRPDPT